MNASLHERTTKKFHLREFEVVAGCKVHLQTYACTVMSFLVLKEQGKSFMLIADRIITSGFVPSLYLQHFAATININFAVVLLRTRKRMCCRLPSSVRSSPKTSEF